MMQKFGGKGGGGGEEKKGFKFQAFKNHTIYKIKVHSGLSAFKL